MTADADAPPEFPRSLVALPWAVGVWCALNIVSAFELHSERSWLYGLFLTANNNATGSSHKDVYTPAMINHDVDKYLKSGLIQTLIVSAVLVMLAILTRRGKSWGRWVLAALATLGFVFGIGVLVQLVGGVFLSAPFVHKSLTILGGLAALAVTLLLFMPDTRAHFAALRPGGRQSARGGGLFNRSGSGARRTPAAPRTTGPARAAQAGSRPGLRGGGRAGGLGGLFRPPTDTPQSSVDLVKSEPESAPQAASTVNQKRVARRPGSVKPKGSTLRGGRAKSRQQP